MIQSKSLGKLLHRFVSLMLLSVFVFNQSAFYVKAAVSVAEGIYSYDTIDLSIGGLYPLFIQRHYESAHQDGSPITDGPFGYGTSLGVYSLRAEPADNNTVRLYLPTGGQQVFIYDSSKSAYLNQNYSDPIKGTFTKLGNTLKLTLETECVNRKETLRKKN